MSYGGRNQVSALIEAALKKSRESMISLLQDRVDEDTLVRVLTILREQADESQ